MAEDLGNVTVILKAHGRTLQALRDAQQDRTRRLTRVEDHLVRVEDRLGNVEADLGTVKIGVHAILDLLDAHLARKPRLSLPALRRAPGSGRLPSSGTVPPRNRCAR